MSMNDDLRCEDAIRLLAQYLDRELDSLRAEELERHLRTCRTCYSRAEFERRLMERLATLGAADVPLSLHRRILELVGGEM